MFNQDLKDIQSHLKNMGHDPGPIDGLWGRRTKAAVESLISHSGQPIQFNTSGASASVPLLPWIAEGMKCWGMHEVEDKAALEEYLRSDGHTLGDPSVLPWCGDFAETVTKNSLPSEKFPGALGKNPYWARNWALLGRQCPAVFGAFAVFVRPGGGHIGWLVGEEGPYYHVFGGNQGNRVGIVSIDKNRLHATRWPLTYPENFAPLSANPNLTEIYGHGGGPTLHSENEA